MSTISSTISTGITLGTGTYASPLTITSTGAVENSGTGDAIFGLNTQAWTIDNAGTVSAAAVDSNGIYLGAGGYVDNRSTGLIAGVGYGVNLYSSGGTVVNAGTITASGTHGYGVSIYGGGLFTNSAGLVAATKTGVYIGAGNGTVSNFATIQSTGTGTAGAAVVLNPHSGHVGSISNAATGIIVATGGTAVFNGLNALDASGAATIDNAGTIASTWRDAIHLRAGNDLVTNSGSAALIAGYRYGIYANAGTLDVSNSGTIENTGSLGDAGIFFYKTGGQITNGAPGDTAPLISGDGWGIRSLGTPSVTVNNFATIASSGGRGIELGTGSVTNGAPNDTAALVSAALYSYGVETDQSGGTVVNFATIVGGVGLAGASLVVNGAPGDTAALLVTSSYAGAGVDTGSFPNGLGTVQNFATIDAAGALGRGVRMDGGGSVYNAASGRISGGLYGVGIYGSGGTVVNLGTIVEAGAPRFNPAGVRVDVGGAVVNGAAGATGALISGTEYGINIQFSSGAVSTITNYGTILATATNGYGVYVHRAGSSSTGSGTFINAGTASLVSGARYGVKVRGTGAAVSNFGTITASASGSRSGAVYGYTIFNRGLVSGYQNGAVLLDGYLSNSSTIVATGGTGVGIYTFGSPTIVDAGTISGGAHAIFTNGGQYQHARLVVEAGYKIVGGVYTFSPQYNDLELSGALGAVSASLDVLGTSFGTVVFGTPGNETLLVSNTSGAFPGAISGFATFTDVIDLTQIGTDGTISSQSATAVTVTGSLGSLTLPLDPSDSANLVTSSDGHNGTDLAVACFCRGTRILTICGEVAVEELAIGDRVVTLSGEARPIKWIGRRAYDARFVAGSKKVLPVHIAAGALGGGLPARDLRVSPEHAMFIDGALVAARLLVDGTTIVQSEAGETVEYHHIELDTHDIILAEGAPTESYVECDNRGMFHNAAEFARLYLQGEAGAPQFCAPRLEDRSPELAGIRAGILGRRKDLAA